MRNVTYDITADFQLLLGDDPTEAQIDAAGRLLGCMGETVTGEMLDNVARLLGFIGPKASTSPHTDGTIRPYDHP